MGKCLAECNLPYCEITVCDDCFHNDVCDDRYYLTENNCSAFCSKYEIQRWKDLAEQGRLVEVPRIFNIKVGDKLFDVVKCQDGKVRIRKITVDATALFGTLSS